MNKRLVYAYYSDYDYSVFVDTGNGTKVIYEGCNNWNESTSILTDLTSPSAVPALQLKEWAEDLANTYLAAHPRTSASGDCQVYPTVSEEVSSHKVRSTTKVTACYHKLAVVTVEEDNAGHAKVSYTDQKGQAKERYYNSSWKARAVLNRAKYAPMRQTASPKTVWGKVISY